MAAALGPPEVIAQLENAAKVLMVSAPPRPSLRATLHPSAPPRPPTAWEPAREAAWRRSTGVSCGCPAARPPSWGCLCRGRAVAGLGFPSRARGSPKLRAVWVGSPARGLERRREVGAGGRKRGSARPRAVGTPATCSLVLLSASLACRRLGAPAAPARGRAAAGGRRLFGTKVIWAKHFSGSLLGSCVHFILTLRYREFGKFKDKKG